MRSGTRATGPSTRFSWRRAESSLAAVLVAILVLAGISWGIARWLKKARIVVAD